VVKAIVRRLRRPFANDNVDGFVSTALDKDCLCLYLWTTYALGSKKADAAAGRWAELVKCFEGFYEDVQRRPDTSTGALWTHYKDMLFIKNVN